VKAQNLSNQLPSVNEPADAEYCHLSSLFQNKIVMVITTTIIIIIIIIIITNE
jgi:hypothetical protein